MESDTTQKRHARELLAVADVQIDGTRPWDIHVHNDAFYQRVLGGGSLALGEAYMDGWWDSDAIDQFFARIIRSNLAEHLKGNVRLLLFALGARLFNRQSKSRAFQVGERHYDIGNDLYTRMLDETMAYSCGYWKGTSDLHQAQQNKLDLICRKIGLKSGQHVLDIGCGWASFAYFAAKEYGATVTGITVSKEQRALGLERCAGLPVDIHLKDYRDMHGQFDHVVSVGMFEHVGVKNYRDFFTVAKRCLKESGLLLLHTIGGNVPVASGDPWIDAYIFPNAVLPAASQISGAYQGFFVMEDWHNFGQYYDNTLMAWFESFHRAWPELKDAYGERFYRMWKYYLLSCAGLFRARGAQLWQIVCSHEGLLGGYEPVR